MENILKQIEQTHQKVYSISMALAKINTYDTGMKYIVDHAASDLHGLNYKFEEIEDQIGKMIKAAEDVPVLPGEATIDTEAFPEVPEGALDDCPY